jgi:hypothetical protein
MWQYRKVTFPSYSAPVSSCILFCEACPFLGNKEVSSWRELVVANDRFGILGSCNHFYVLTKMILGDKDGYTSFHPSYHFNISEKSFIGRHP